MECIKRTWLPKPKASFSAGILRRGPLRGALLLSPVPALKTSSAGGPLSLNDIIAFESELPSLLIQETVPELRVDELIDRAARVLREVNSVLAPNAEPQPGQQQQQQQQPGAATATLSTTTRPGRAAPTPADAASSNSVSDPAPGSGPGSPLSRALFGGTAKVSELQATLTRQALQKTLEASPAPSLPDAGGSASSTSDVAASGSGSSPATEPQARPAWAQALFSSTSTSTSTSAASSSRSGSPGSSSGPPTGPVLRNRNASPGPSNSGGGGGWEPFSASSSSSFATAPRSRPQQQPPPQLQPAAPSRRPLATWAPLAFAEVDLSVPTELLLKSEESQLAEAARSAVLPPLQSVVDLTAAVRPPTRGLELDMAAGAAQQEQATVSAAVAVSEEEVVQGGALGRRLRDGAGRLADGTRFEKLSGTDRGPDGYVKMWEVLRGVTGDGQVQWEECWWQASNRYGLRELGAFKKGTAESGAAWVEEWKEVLYTHPTNLRLVIERTAHKWARDESSDEWEEKWGECFEEAGRVHKWADKWAKAGSNVWHERWGEDYDGRGACQKWTDKWAERLLPGGGQEQWGDKWTETFGHGKGTKHGEVWSSNSGGSRYNRWWNEEHFGDSRVRKWGNSTSGEYWDTVEHMDTYYNPVPHFGFQHAVRHSPQLWAVSLPAPDEGDGSGGDDDGLGVGLGRL